MWCLIVKEEEREKARENILSLDTKETGELSGGSSSSCVSSAKRPRCNTSLLPYLARHQLLDSSQDPALVPWGWQLLVEPPSLRWATIHPIKPQGPVARAGIEAVKPCKEGGHENSHAPLLLHLHGREIPFKVTLLWWKNRFNSWVQLALLVS